MKRIICILIVACMLLLSVPSFAQEEGAAENEVVVTPAPKDTPVKAAEPEKKSEKKAENTESAPSDTPTPKPEKSAAKEQQTPAASDTPSVAPSDTPTQTPGDTPSQTPGDTPSQTPPGDTPSHTPEAASETMDGMSVPDGLPLDDPGDTPAPSVIPENAEAWLKTDGDPVYGTLKELIELAGDEAEIFIVSEKPMFVENAPLLKLYGLKLKPDPAVFTGAEYQVCISEQSPEKVTKPVLSAVKGFAKAEVSDTRNLYIWVQKLKEPEDTDPTTPPDQQVKVEVAADGYVAGEWSSTMPVFTLSGIPEGEKMNYAVVVYDERIAVLSENVYTAEVEGIYTVRFAILDSIGDIVDASEKFTLWLDYTKPEVAIVHDESKNYTMHITASDAGSGVKELSLNGGEAWIELQNDEVYTYTASKAMSFAPGMIQVRDVAGNVYVCESGFELVAVSGAGGYGGGGGGGGGGDDDGKKAPQHSSGDGEGAEYDALELVLPEEPMHTLMINNTELALSLELDEAEGISEPASVEPKFTAELKWWTPPVADPAEGDAETDVEADAEAEETPAFNTLMLTAEPEMDLGDRFTYRWQFNGEVYRILANSGIQYLALRVGDSMVALPTEGFTGGTKYTELKMLGVSTRKFDYGIRMSINLDPDFAPQQSEFNFSEDCELVIVAEVENMQYTLSSEPKGEMYYYDVYLGPVEMMDVPFGSYAPAGGHEQQ